MSECGYAHVAVGCEPEREPAAYEEKQRHVYLADKFENSGTVDIAHTHCKHVAHNNQKDCYAFQNIEIMQALCHVFLLSAK